jgi:hypothetical protein
MAREAGEAGALEAAIHRLDRAVAQLEVRMTGLLNEAQQSSGQLFDQDRSKLAQELDAARGRERDLEEAGTQASKALGRAIADIRAALGEDLPEDDDSGLDDGPPGADEPDHELSREA